MGCHHASPCKWAESENTVKSGHTMTPAPEIKGTKVPTATDWDSIADHSDRNKRKYKSREIEV